MDKISQTALDKITGYENNPVIHTDKAIEKMAAILTEFGCRPPVLIQSDGLLVDGHLRYLAACKLGWDSIPTIDCTGWTSAQIKAYRPMSRNSAGWASWDEKKLRKELDDLARLEFPSELLGFDTSELENLGIEGDGDNVGNVGGDDLPDESKKEPVVKRGDLFQLGSHRLMCGDCTDGKDVKALMGGKKADLWITDPPYGVSYADKNEFLNAMDEGNRNQTKIKNDHESIDDMYEFWKKAVLNIYEVTSDKCSYYWFACQGGDQMMMMMSISHANWKVRHELIWVKNNHVLGRSDYNYKHEPILFGWKKDGTHKFYGGFQTSVLEFPKPLKSDLHPTMKPLELVVLLIKNSSEKNHLIIDPFLGSGTTLIAAEQTGRRCFGMEIAENYCDVIIRRWYQYCQKNKIKPEFKHINGTLELGEIVSDTTQSELLLK